jgi:hypothetical protein
MQNALDRVHPVPQTESEDLSRFLPAEVRKHLEGCPGCRDFLSSLGTFAPVLRNQLDESIPDYPNLKVAAVLRDMTDADSQGSTLQTHRGGSIPAAFQRLRNWLFAPVGKPAAVYRWAAVSAVTVALASLIGVRIYSVSRTNRAIEEQIDRIVELVYQEPLLPDIESALLRTRPAISDYVEDLNRGLDILSEDTDSESYLN